MKLIKIQQYIFIYISTKSIQYKNESLEYNQITYKTLIFLIKAYQIKLHQMNVHQHSHL